MALDEQEKIEVKDLISLAELSKVNHRHKGTGGNESPKINHSDLTDLLVNSHPQYFQKVSAITGEAISSKDSILLGDGVTDIFYDEKNIISNSDALMGKTTASSKLAQSFQSAIAIDVGKVTIRIRKVGTPGDNVEVSLQADSSGDPSETDLESKTFVGSSLSTSYENKVITFDNIEALDASTTYWLVIERSGSVDASNYYEIEYQNTNVYSNGQLKNKDDVTGNWETTDFGATSDAYFKLHRITEDGKAYKASSFTEAENNLFIGFADSAVAKGVLLNIQTAGLVEGFTGLTTVSRYHLTDTRGIIGLVAGTTVRFVGHSVGTTRIYMTPSETLELTALESFTLGEDLIINDAVCLPSYSRDFEKSSSQSLSITNGNQTGLGLTGDFTIEFLVNLETATTSADSGIIEKQNTSGNQRSYALNLKNVSGISHVQLTLSSDGSAGTNVTKNITLGINLVVGTWYHIAISYDASAGTAEVYLDGVNTGSADSLPNSIFNGTATFYLGGLVNNNIFADGKIDEARIWNDIRTPTEIDDNKAKIIPGNSSNLVGYWRLDNSLLDETANNNDLTANGGGVFSRDTIFGSQIFKTDASFANTADSFLGFIIASGNEGEIVSVAVVGILGGFTGLEIGNFYYLSNTPGEIQSSVGTVTRKVGIAVSTTKILISNIW